MNEDHKEGMLAILAIIFTVNMIAGSIMGWIMLARWIAGH